MEIRFYLRQLLAGTAIYVVLAMIASIAQVPMVGYDNEAWRQADARAPIASPRIIRLRQENIVP